MSLNRPKISIITICYNAEKTIEHTVKSVLYQKYPDIEYILIDGASKDRTLEILQPYKAKITKLVSAPDRGLYDALNKGLEASEGDIIGILHADDFYPDENIISDIVAMFTVNPKIEAISTSVKIFKNEQFMVPFRTYLATSFRIWQFRIGMQPPHPGFFIKRLALQKVGNYNTEFKISGDFDWLLRVLRIHKIKTSFSEYVSVYMRDGGVSSAGFKSKILMNHENLKSLKSHHIYSNQLFIYSKYFLKIFQLNFKSFLKKTNE